MSTSHCLKAGSILLMSLTVSAHASLYPASLDHKSDVIKRALVDSSVAAIVEPDTHMAATNWINKAQRNLELGNYKTARSQLLEAGRLLYPMTPNSDLVLSESKKRHWLAEIDRVMTTLMPVANEIAERKQADQQQLALAAFLQQNGRDALTAEDLDTANQHFNNAYNILQQQIVSLRSGDELVIEQPDSQSRAGWEDAERRFADWRFFADWMIEQAEAMEADAQLIISGNEAADALYADAQLLAQNANWDDAVKLMDKAYRVLEQNWRKAGVDI